MHIGNQEISPGFIIADAAPKYSFNGICSSTSVDITPAARERCKETGNWFLSETGFKRSNIPSETFALSPFSEIRLLESISAQPLASQVKHLYRWLQLDFQLAPYRDPACVFHSYYVWIEPAIIGLYFCQSRIPNLRVSAASLIRRGHSLDPETEGAGHASRVNQGAGGNSHLYRRSIKIFSAYSRKINKTRAVRMKNINACAYLCPFVICFYRLNVLNRNGFLIIGTLS